MDDNFVSGAHNDDGENDYDGDNANRKAYEDEDVENVEDGNINDNENDDDNDNDNNDDDDDPEDEVIDDDHDDNDDNDDDDNIHMDYNLESTLPRIIPFITAISTGVSYFPRNILFIQVKKAKQRPKGDPSICCP